MSRPIQRLCRPAVLAIVLAAAGAAGAAGPAGASSPTTPTTSSVRGCGVEAFNDGRASLLRQLEGRQVQLAALTRDVELGRDLSASDRTTLTTDLANEGSGIAALRPQATADTTCAALLATGRAMVTDYRVYVVMTPQVRLTVAGDTELYVAAQLAAAEPRVTVTIDDAAGDGEDVDAARTALADLEHQVATADQAADGIAAQVLAFTPASYPGCWSAFVADQSRLRDGQAALHQADTDLHTIEGVVRGTAATTTTTTTAG